MKPLILIVDATGATGSVATKLLLDKGFPIRAFAHKEDERTRKLKALGAEIFVGELLDFRAVRRAFEGVKRARRSSCGLSAAHLRPYARKNFDVCDI